MKHVTLWFLLLSSGFIHAQAPDTERNLPPRFAVYIQNFVVVPVATVDMRLIALSPDDALLVNVGTLSTFGMSWYHGGPRHGMQLGMMSWDRQGIAIEGFYRYTSPRGLLVKVGMSYVPEEELLPSVGLGFAF